MRAILLSRAFISLFAQNFLFLLGLNLVTVIPPWLTDLGANKTYIGFFMNMNSLALVLLVIPLMYITDRMGRKKLLQLGYLLAILSFIASLFFTTDLVWLAVFRAFSTLVFCAGFTIHGAEAFELLPRDKRASGAAIFGISGLLSNPVASFIGESLMKSGGITYILLAMILCFSLALLLVSLSRYHKPAEPALAGGFLRIAQRKELRLLLVLTLVFGGAWSVYSSFLAGLSLERFGFVRISVFYSAFTFIAVAGRLFFAPLLDKWPKNILLGLCFAAIALSLVISSFANSVWHLIPAGLLYGLGHSLLFPLLSSLFVNSGNTDETLPLNSLYASTNTLGNFFWGFSLGVLGDFGGTIIIFLGMALVMFLVIPLGLMQGKTKKAGLE